MQTDTMCYICREEVATTAIRVACPECSSMACLACAAAARVHAKDYSTEWPHTGGPFFAPLSHAKCPFGHAFSTDTTAGIRGTLTKTIHVLPHPWRSGLGMMLFLGLTHVLMRLLVEAVLHDDALRCHVKAAVFLALAALVGGHEYHVPAFRLFAFFFFFAFRTGDGFVTGSTSFIPYLFTGGIELVVLEQPTAHQALAFLPLHFIQGVLWFSFGEAFRVYDNHLRVYLGTIVMVNYVLNFYVARRFTKSETLNDLELVTK